MRNYARINAPAPDRIAEKRAHIVGELGRILQYVPG